MTRPNDEGAGVCGTGPHESFDNQHDDSTSDHFAGKALAMKQVRYAPDSLPRMTEQALYAVACHCRRDVRCLTCARWIRLHRQLQVRRSAWRAKS